MVERMHYNIHNNTTNLAKLNYSAYVSLTPGLSPNRVQPLGDRLLIDVVLLQQPRLQQRHVALLEVDDDRAVDVLTLVRTHRHHRRQTPLTFTHTENTYTIHSVKRQCSSMYSVLGLTHKIWHNN